MESSDITNKKKEMDKQILNLIRMCIVTEEVDKVFTYIDLLHFSQSIKLCVSLCESMNQFELGQKIQKFISDKER